MYCLQNILAATLRCDIMFSFGHYYRTDKNTALKEVINRNKNLQNVHRSRRNYDSNFYHADIDDNNNNNSDDQQSHFHDGYDWTDVSRFQHNDDQQNLDGLDSLGSFGDGMPDAAIGHFNSGDVYSDHPEFDSTNHPSTGNF